ncbi:unnamed protein product [Scytosiphon promiscuus]
MPARAFLLCWAVLQLPLGHVLSAAAYDRNSTRALSPFLTNGKDCPPCESLFSKAKTTMDGKRIQNVEIQLRGEPKSGTTMMYAWAVGILARTCEHLQATYGHASCRIDPDITEALADSATMTFEPGLAAQDVTSCPCDSIDMVRLTIVTYRKHILPVNSDCRWNHPGGFTDDIFPCTTVGGRPVENYADILGCMEEAACEITDDKLQFAPLRDPRAVAVSTYFNRRRKSSFYTTYPDAPRTVEEGALKSLTSVAQWIALRHILFEGLMANRSETFWYEDATEDPLDWHFRWTALAGLRLPISWVEGIASLRLIGPWMDMTTGVNPHPGGHKVSETRTWRDEVSPEIIGDMDAILRQWLPGVLLARLGISAY